MKENMKNRIKHIHFVGVGGTGMCGIAEILQNEGYFISGSDMKVNPATQHLHNIGVTIYQGHAAEHIEGADVVVTSTAVKKNNPEVVAALEHGIPVIPRAMMLAEIMRFGCGIAIAGTHGKTTTTSLTASVLAEAGLDPTFVIGGRLNAAGSNAKLGKGEYIVAEADESDASFLYLTPLFTVITNIDTDHMDTYDHDVEKLHQAFIDFVHRMPFYGKAFVCIDSDHVRQILPKINKPFITYGLDPQADLYADHLEAHGVQMNFTVHTRKKSIPSFDVTLNLPGRHNVLNALAVIGVALECGVPVSAIQDGLAKFSGVGRRFQSYGEIALPNGGYAMVIDDYGHHPVEMMATIAATRNAYAHRRLLISFQPHRYTRTRDLFEDFVQVLSQADGVVLTDVYAAEETPIVAADSKALTRAIRVLGKVEPIYVACVDDMAPTLLSLLRDGDVLLNMGAGSINKVPGDLVALSAKSVGIKQ